MEVFDRIVEVARKLFCSQGCKRVTMDEIAVQLGMSKKTLYQYHSQKDSLIKEIMQRDLAAHVKQIHEIRASAENPLDECLKSLEFMSSIMATHSPMYFVDLQKFYPNVWRLFLQFKSETLIGVIESNLEQGVKEQLYRKNINIKILARMRIESIELAFDQSKFPMAEFSLVDVQRESLLHFLYGIVTIKGHELINKYLNIKEN